MTLPKLSVIVPNYNHGAYIREQLQAILEQSYQPLEIIVIDDCSTDNSVEIITGFLQSHPHVQLVCNEQNLGINLSFNQAVEMARGNYVCCCPADDRVLPGFFEQSLNLLAEHPEAGLSCSHVAFLDDTTEEIDRHEDWFHLDDHPRYVSPEELIKVVGPHGLWIAGVTCIFKRTSFLECGKYITDLKWYSDWFVWHIIAFRYGVCYIPEALAAIRILPTSYSSQGLKDSIAQKAVMKSLLSLLKSETYQDVLGMFQRSDVLADLPIVKTLLRVS